MPSLVATSQRERTTVPAKLSLKAGVTKKSIKSPNARIKSPFERFFWYTSNDKVACLATTNAQATPPLQINSYDYRPSIFTSTPRPSNFPLEEKWPPTDGSALLCSFHRYGRGNKYSYECVGDKCYTRKRCYNKHCEHTLKEWEKATSRWQDRFDLRMTEDGERGIGVYTKSRFKKGAVLGWYAGEIKPSDYGNENSDYLLEVKIGPITDASDVPSYPPDSLPHSNTVLIDAAHKGNWTRFINHSCNAYAIFHQTRVGDTTVMIVEAVRDVPAGVELTVNYGLDYYGPKSKRVCHCGADNCVGTQRRALREKRSMIDLEMRKKRVKRCKRVCPDEK